MRDSSFRLGAAFALTAVLGYAACTVVFWLFPGAAANFMSALFHGLDFRRLMTAGDFTFGSFVYAAAVLGGWAFVLGSLFGWVSGRLGVDRSH